MKERQYRCYLSLVRCGMGTCGASLHWSNLTRIRAQCPLAVQGPSGPGMSVCRLAVWQFVQWSGMDLLLVCPLPIARCPLCMVPCWGRLGTAEGTGASQYLLAIGERRSLRCLLALYPCLWLGAACARGHDFIVNIALESGTP